MTRPPRGLRHLSDVLTDVMTDPELPEDVRDTLARAMHPSRKCPCAECMRAYLKTVEGQAG